MVGDRCSAGANGIYVVPVLKHYLIYAPLHDLAALVDREAAVQLQRGLCSGREPKSPQLAQILATLQVDPPHVPLPKRGEFLPPFLGLIPTRSCNLACEYCGFLSADASDRAMDLSLVRRALEWYLERLYQAGVEVADVHFFGGEPFCAEEVVHFAYHLARLKAAELGRSVRFEVATNGTFDAELCQWVADSLDSVILSLDGPPDIQDRHRHRPDGRGSSEVVLRNARILSDGPTELSFRVCVTAETVRRMADIAAWLCQEFRPTSVCFEPVQPTPHSQAADLIPPEAFDFGCSFVEAASILEAHGVEAVYAAADIRAKQVSFCPVGRDVAIVSPDGTISACYLLRRDWEARGLDLRLGRIADGSVTLDGEAIEAARSLNVWNKPLCANCFCRWHCAGGCHVNHTLASRPGAYDTLCLMTRIIALRNVLKAMGRDGVIRDLLGDRQALRRAVYQASDDIRAMGIPA